MIPDGTSEVIITVAVGGNPAILLQAHWMHLMIDWWGTQLKAFRMLGKSAINGVLAHQKSAQIYKGNDYSFTPNDIIKGLKWS